MLMHLSVRNIALIDQINIDFSEGLNILTGETGAGKSIIIDAVNLVLGERADRDLIQTGKDYALVEALFDVTNLQQINGLLEEYGIESEEDETLLLMRELSVSGKNVCRINGRIVTLSVLKSVSRHLVDIHGQHQHQSLLSIEQHRELLDMLGGEAIAKTKEEVRHLYNRWKKIQKEIDKISGIGMDGERRKDILTYQINEIESVNLSPEKKRNWLVNDLNWQMEKKSLIYLTQLIMIYTGSNTYPSVSDLMARSSSDLMKIAELDTELSELSHRLESLQYQLEDIIFEIRDYRDSFHYDPYRLDEVDKRLDIIRALKRKYGSSISEIFLYLKNIKEELEVLENSQELLDELIKEEEKALSQLLETCGTLSDLRKETAKIFEKELLSQLKELGMDKSSFSVNIERPDDILDTSKIKGRLTAKGYDSVEFMISTNPGEPVKPLSKIISGGEMSRIMLAFKTIFAQVDNIPTLIFDEIDVGIGGRIAHVVGEKMGSIAHSRQVICITHLPQIAAMADIHYKIEKRYIDQHTRTTVRKLDDSKRVEEIANMTGVRTYQRLI